MSTIVTIIIITFMINYTFIIFIINNIITIIIVITIATNINFLVIKISAKTVHCFRKVSCEFIFGSFHFFVFLNWIHATTTWC